MINPLVSIIIPTYNRKDLIQQTLDSVLGQTYKNWECLIVDDGSNDSTEVAIRNYIEKDTRFKFYERPGTRKKGASSCRNFGLEKSKGELIQFLDSDDLLSGNKLEEQVKKYEVGDLSLFTCKWGGFEETSDLKKRFKYQYHSYRDFDEGINLLVTFGRYKEFFPQHVYLVPRALIDKAGNWNEDLSNNDDAEFFTRVILQSSKIKFASQTCVYYRYSGLNKLSSFTDEQKAISAIKSWKLIESHINKKYPGKAKRYLGNAKINLHKLVAASYKELLLKESEFFEKNDRIVLFQRINGLLKNFLKSN